MKKYLLLLAASAAALLCGCTRYSYGTVSLENASTRGTPVALRMSASDSGTCLLGIGNDPSLKLALDKLYARARNAGFRMNGNNYAFQNLLVEKEYSPLYPIIGTVTLTVCGDLYAYENNWAAEETAVKKTAPGSNPRGPRSH